MSQAIESKLSLKDNAPIEDSGNRPDLGSTHDSKAPNGNSTNTVSELGPEIYVRPLSDGGYRLLRAGESPWYQLRASR
ncbi:hypothetical protein V865_006252 [Kwoniella europaea PYCC6329]|uniref:Uncharacterized protein n=1 Tax=Kwoniella europaea PYCC6329 TaxID=1423913 RepID=A0AAX4KNS9_9TREE